MPYRSLALRRRYGRTWLADRRAAWLKEHGPCRCGSWEQLEVDHIDPAQKVDHRLWSWSKERRDAELAKCQVLCHTCHLDKTRENGDYAPRAAE
jgi:5-methylcytosine-specific restriction endonuclease McrA